ncbi:SGNH/GDSL hydrolase family protein [Calothrix sp. PCC 7507]|uniref:SGNH/GDSL hydrolase family protein n=1 Tax=Calothrix sp. PCC 7507 TaxID=99598 RepID=UPI00029F223F|nr:SGNH/GDSL hydrolase family protein [Calothrix sp. PCC 7507]AFY35084.1 lipolytic protein G-D-S-L family [Calothrix sp. PCC 7507]
MRDPYLLAAGLLTGLAIPASALPQMSIILSENSRIQWDLKQGSQPTASENLPSVDVSLPEFSQQAVKPLADSHPILGQSIIPSVDVSLPEFSQRELLAPTESSFNPSFQGSNPILTSGSQLYYQRLAALKTGQTSKRVDEDSLQSLWESGKKHQLTYEDWKALLALEAKAIALEHGANRLNILVGDSLSLWFPQGKLPSGKLWLNQGISGDTSGGVLKRLAAFSATHPDVIYVMAGINDLRKGVSDQVILLNHRRIIRSLRQTHPKAKIIIQSILPTRLEKIPNKRIRHLNAQLALIAKQEKANYLDIYSWFTDFEGNLRFDLTTDGLHLSPDGYDVWRAVIQQIELKLSKRDN